jgi:hypothetical protein
VSLNSWTGSVTRMPRKGAATYGRSRPGTESAVMTRRRVTGGKRSPDETGERWVCRRPGRETGTNRCREHGSHSFVHRSDRVGPGIPPRSVGRGRERPTGANASREGRGRAPSRPDRLGRTRLRVTVSVYRADLPVPSAVPTPATHERGDTRPADLPDRTRLVSRDTRRLTRTPARPRTAPAHRGRPRRSSRAG